MDEREVEDKQNNKEHAEELFEKIKSMIPSGAGFVKIEFEGPDIVVYLKNAKLLYEDDSVVRGIASSIKKKLVIRSEPNSLMAKTKAEEIIRELVPKDAIIGSIKFVDEFSEVYIEALKPGVDLVAVGLDVRGTRLAARGWTAEGGELFETLDRLNA
ncbi:MAG: hypothetical protein ABSA33_02200, partial [Candidatus Micrarchaeaceae archaeon]